MYALVLLWCVRQMRMVQSGIMIAVIHTLIFQEVCTSNAYGLKSNNDNSHSCIDITMVCTSNAYASTWNHDNGHSCIDIQFFVR